MFLSAALLAGLGMFCLTQLEDEEDETLMCN